MFPGPCDDFEVPITTFIPSNYVPALAGGGRVQRGRGRGGGGRGAGRGAQGGRGVGQEQPKAAEPTPVANDPVPAITCTVTP